MVPSWLYWTKWISHNMWYIPPRQIDGVPITQGNFPCHPRRLAPGLWLYWVLGLCTWEHHWGAIGFYKKWICAHRNWAGGRGHCYTHWAGQELVWQHCTTRGVRQARVAPSFHWSFGSFKLGSQQFEDTQLPLSSTKALWITSLLNCGLILTHWGHCILPFLYSGKPT